LEVGEKIQDGFQSIVEVLHRIEDDVDIWPGWQQVVQAITGGPNVSETYQEIKYCITVAKIFIAISIQVAI